jgi:hypothetical protein
MWHTMRTRRAWKAWKAWRARQAGHTRAATWNGGALAVRTAQGAEAGRFLWRFGVPLAAVGPAHAVRGKYSWSLTGASCLASAHRTARADGIRLRRQCR